MAPRGKNTATSADAWLIEGAEPARTDDPVEEGDFTAVEPPAPEKPVAEDVGAETRQWLAVPEPPDNGSSAADARQAETRKRAPKAKPKPAPEAQALVQRQKDEIAELGARVRELQTELRMQAKETKAAVAEAVEQRESQIEKELSQRFESREADLRSRIEELESELADAKKSAGSKRRDTSEAKPQPKATPRGRAKAPARRGRSARKEKNGKLDLNAATFEELRGLGLSVTQSARLIAYRDVRGGYESLDELDDIPGLPRETRAELRDRMVLEA